MSLFTLNDYFSEVYVIHMETDHERNEHIEKQFSKINTKYSIRPGVIPTSKDRIEYASPLCSQFCSKSMLGIYLAHRRIWEEIVDKELPSAIIFEDDVVFTNNIATQVPLAIKELPEDWDLLHLGCLSCQESSLAFVHLFTDWSKLTKPSLKPYSKTLSIPNATFGNEAYALSLSGARKLLQLLPKASNHVDFMITNNLPKLNHYAIYPQVAYQHPDGFKYTNNGSSVPILLNTFASNIRLQPRNPYNHTTLAYGLSIPLAQVNNAIIINGWSIILFLCGIIHPWTFYIALTLIILDILYVLYYYPNTIKPGQYTFYIYMLSIGFLIRNLI